MASNSASGSGIVPLSGSNYATWKTQCKMTLIRDNLWSIVNGTEVLPETDEGNAQVNYRKRRDKALATIVLAVHPSLLYLLNDPECPCVEKFGRNWRINSSQRPGQTSFIFDGNCTH